MPSSSSQWMLSWTITYIFFHHHVQDDPWMMSSAAKHRVDHNTHITHYLLGFMGLMMDEKPHPKHKCGVFIGTTGLAQIRLRLHMLTVWYGGEPVTLTQA